MAGNNQKVRDRGPFAAAVLIVVLLCSFGLRFYQQSHEDLVVVPTPVLDQLSCEAAGGAWNSCASACRGAAPGATCIAVCVPQCECREDSACPFGYTCQAKIDGIGICR